MNEKMLVIKKVQLFVYRGKKLIHSVRPTDSFSDVVYATMNEEMLDTLRCIFSL